MEAVNDQSANPGGGSLLRYPLRSATKLKDAKSATAELHVHSASRRVRTTPNLAKSMDVLDLSEKEKYVKLPRRLSNPNNSINSPHAIPAGNMTPVTENRRHKLNDQANSNTPMSGASVSSNRRKFSVLSSVSYWLSQIKLSESASKHLISLGFFRLALESGTEPLHLIREELKSYVLRHNLIGELGNTTKDILLSYNIVDDLENLQISESGSQLPEKASQSTDKVAKNSVSLSMARNLKPKFLSENNLVGSNKKASVQERIPAAAKKSSSLKDVENAVNMNDFDGNCAVEKSQKPRKQGETKNPGNNSSSYEVENSPDEEQKLDNKENMEAENLDIYSSNEEIMAN